LDCKRAPLDKKNEVAAAHKTARIQREAPAERAPPPGAPAPKLAKAGAFSAFVDTCDAARAEAITGAIATFIVSCALPFSIVQSVAFVAMLRSLNSAYPTELGDFLVEAMENCHDDDEPPLAAGPAPAPADEDEESIISADPE